MATFTGIHWIMNHVSILTVPLWRWCTIKRFALVYLSYLYQPSAGVVSVSDAVSTSAPQTVCLPCKLFTGLVFDRACCFNLARRAWCVSELHNDTRAVFLPCVRAKDAVARDAKKETLLIHGAPYHGDDQSSCSNILLGNSFSSSPVP